ncbi:MAG: cytochrome C [Nitrospinota bacterium]
MKIIISLVSIWFFTGMAFYSFAGEMDSSMGEMTHNHGMHSMNDGRVSLGLSPTMKQHQLSNMRSHLEAIQSIIGLVSEGAFDKASQIAHSKLGLTDEMKKMCNMFSNGEFRSLGIAFHKSADKLGDELQTKDVTKSLRALRATMGYCVQCHATFRQ